MIISKKALDKIQDSFIIKILYSVVIERIHESCSVVFDSLRPHGLALQAPLSMGFSRQEYWSGLPFPSPRNLSDPGIEPGSPALQADSLPSE